MLNNISILFFLLFLIHCTPESTSQKRNAVAQRDNKTQKTKRSPTNPKRDSRQSKNSIFIVNNTNETLQVIHNPTLKKKSMSHGDCFSFRKRDLKNLQLNPSICSWFCPDNLMGCRHCPSQKGHYELVQHSQPYDPVYKKISDNAPDKEDCPSFLP